MTLQIPIWKDGSQAMSGALVDACFIDLQSIELIRSAYIKFYYLVEKDALVLLHNEKNTGRASPKEKAMFGRKCDGIARKVGSLDEYAISEEGRIWNGENGTKYLSDGGLKMPKIMKDMLHQKINKHGLSFVKTHQLEIIGFLHSAQYLQLLVMDIPSWYVCRIQRKPLCEVPKTLVNVDELITIIHEVLVAKFHIIRCLKKLNDYNINNEILKARLRKRKKLNDDYEFPKSHDTPTKKGLKTDRFKQ
ncbi:4752_t:CDS:2 [Funneliformis mosseae]|uniref:4752_t:CDS:1 n=1 Tax=Funneliformis mosseae TaxID=27381 RepID=A0A9N9I9W7_FUNMO|nr:4752_t:CDS:2 [Funneliformis mosseae]